MRGRVTKRVSTRQRRSQPSAPGTTMAVESGGRFGELARQLRLTPKQRAFVEALVADPDFNQARAARTAGCGRGAEVTASKWLRLAKVQEYLGALLVAAEAVAEGQSEGSVASAAEVLQALTVLARANLMNYVMVSEDGKSFEFTLRNAALDTANAGYAIKSIGHDSATATPVIEVSDRLRALEILARLKGMEKCAPGPQVNVRVVERLMRLPAEQLKDLYFGDKGPGPSH